MQRHSALVPLSHDHHQALVAARRARRAVEPAERRSAGRALLVLLAVETRLHFRVEEEQLFPLLEPADDLVARAVREHAELRALQRRLAHALGEADDVPADLLAELGERLEEHVRLEERELFPRVERHATAEQLATLDPASAAPATAAEVLDRRTDAAGGPGPVWGLASADLNVTLLDWPPGRELPEHVNAERDVLYVGLAGEAALAVGGAPHALAAADLVLVPAGAARALRAGPAGVRYLSVHLRREGLTIASRRQPARSTMQSGLSFASLEPESTERFHTLRRELGVETFGLNQIRLQPRQRGRIHRHRRQEEVYLVLDGVLTLVVEGEEHELGRGQLVRVAPELRRQLVNRGSEPVLLLALGGAEEHVGRDGEAFASWEDTEPRPPQETPMPDDLPA